MSNAITRQTVTIDGNLILHGRTGIDLPMVFQTAEGLPRDARTLVLFFEVEGRFRVQMPAYDSGDAINVRYLRVPAALAATLPYKEDRVGFILKEETDPVNPVAVWTGRIWADGFFIQPPVIP